MKKTKLNFKQAACGAASIVFVPYNVCASSANNTVLQTQKEVTHIQIKRAEQQMHLHKNTSSAARTKVTALSQIGGKYIIAQNIKFEGATVYSDEEIQEYFKPLLGKKIHLNEFIAATEKLIEHYWQDGYVLAEADVKLSDVFDTDQTIHVHVHEGHLENIKIQGDTEGLKDTLEHYASILKAAKPFRMAAVERMGYLTERMPGLALKSHTTPIHDVKGGGNLDITVEQKKFIPYASVDNFGSRYLGPARGNVSAFTSSLLNPADASSATVLFTPTSKELAYGQVSHDILLSKYGDSLNVRAAHAEAKPGFILKPFHIKGNFTFGQAVITHPFLSFTTHQLSVNGGIESIDASAKGRDLGRIYKDHIRSLVLGVSDAFPDFLQGHNTVSLKLTHGLHMLHATRSSDSFKSLPRGKATFTKLNFTKTREQKLFSNFALAGEAKAQYSWQPLLAASQFSFGGHPFGNAYDPAEITGDHGVALRVELRYSLDSLTSYTNHPVLYPFYDIGKVWNKDKVNLKKDQSAASAGLGVRSDLLEHLRVRFEVAKPLTHKLDARVRTNSHHKKPWRCFFKIEAQL